MINKLSRYEQETVINFNKERDKVWFFTYEKRFMRSIERKKIAETMYDNGKGGKEYVIPYSCLRIQILGKRKSTLT